MTLKKATAILSTALCACLLSGCGVADTSSSSRNEPSPPSPEVSSNTSPQAPPTIESAVPSDSPSETSSSSSDTSSSEITEDLPPASSALSPDLNELESLLGESEILYWLPDEYSLQTSDLDSTSIYAIASQWLRMSAERNGQEIPLNENGTPYFPIDDYNTVTEEVLGISFDYVTLAAQNSDVAPQDMLCVMWGYGTAYSELAVQKDSLNVSNDQFSIIVENSFSSPGDNPVVQVKRLHFTSNPSWQFSPYCLISVEDLGIKP